MSGSILVSRQLLRLCLAGTALAGLSAFTAPARAAGPAFTSADVVSPAASASKVEFDVYLPLRNKDGLKALLTRQQDHSSADYHKFLTPAQFATQFGPARATMDKIAAELAGQGFKVVAQSRSLHLTGTASSVSRAFGANLSMVKDAHGQLRAVALGGLRMSPTLTAAGAQVFAFSPRSLGMHTYSTTVASKIDDTVPDNRYGGKGPYWYDDLRQAYGYPAINTMVTAADGSTQRLDGSTAKIGALMSSDITDVDIRKMFNHEHFRRNSPTTLPTVARRYVGATPGVLTGAFGEASLDTQQEIGGAPGASVTLYDIPDLSDDNVVAGYTAIVEDNTLDLVSSSFGECDQYYTAAYNSGTDFTYYLTMYNELFMQGNAQGITFLASSGDEAGLECTNTNYIYGQPGARWIPGASSPATDPNVTGVGGTNLITTYRPGAGAARTSRYKEENAYSDPRYPEDVYGLGEAPLGLLWGAGGGPSIFFEKPDYQSGVHTISTMRSTPDIGMTVGGCPGGSKLPCNGGDTAINGNGNQQRSYVLTYIQGGLYGLIGTSVSSPELASALALMVELHGRQGNLNPYLYSLYGSTTAFHQGIPGYNGVHPNTYPAANYNYTVGLGTPYVANLIGVPAGTPLAGTPQTATNY